MRKDVQEALENAIAEFEKRQQAEQERLRERGVHFTIYRGATAAMSGSERPSARLPVND